MHTRKKNIQDRTRQVSYMRKERGPCAEITKSHVVYNTNNSYIVFLMFRYIRISNRQDTHPQSTVTFICTDTILSRWTQNRTKKKKQTRIKRVLQSRIGRMLELLIYTIHGRCSSVRKQYVPMHNIIKWSRVRRYEIKKTTTFLLWMLLLWGKCFKANEYDFPPLKKKTYGKMHNTRKGKVKNLTQFNATHSKADRSRCEFKTFWLGGRWQVNTTLHIPLNIRSETFRSLRTRFTTLKHGVFLCAYLTHCSTLSRCMAYCSTHSFPTWIFG